LAAAAPKADGFESMKVLLLGMNGQVGWELKRALAPLGELLALDFDSPSPLAADFTRPDDLATMVRAVAPQWIVNAAAYTAVDKAEGEPETARQINAEAPSVLAREAADLDAWLVHYSTDYVFDGSGVTPWHEDSPTAPLNVYGKTKLEGEEAVRASGCRHLILRTSWVYAARGGNFVRTMLRLGALRDRLEVIDDQVGAPTGAELLADVTAHAMRRLVDAPALAGTYHVTAGGETSWHGYARYILDFARTAGQPIRVADEAILPVHSSAYPSPARRPLNSRLDTRKLQTQFGLQLPDWRIGVERMLSEVLGAD
jgi:dTDP-4-dehydrorhamnose reductase